MFGSIAETTRWSKKPDNISQQQISTGSALSSPIATVNNPKSSDTNISPSSSSNVPYETSGGNILTQDYQEDEFDIIAGQQDAPFSFQSDPRAAELQFRIAPKGGLILKKQEYFVWNANYYKQDWSEEFIDIQKPWKKPLLESDPPKSFHSSFPIAPYIAGKALYQEFHFALPEKMTLNEFVNQYRSTDGKFILSFDNNLIINLLNDRIPNVTRNQYDIIPYNIIITSQKSTLPCTYKCRFTSTAGPTSLGPAFNPDINDDNDSYLYSSSLSSSKNISSTITTTNTMARADWFNPAGISSTSKHLNESTYHHIVYSNTLRDKCDKPQVVYKAPNEVNSAEFLRWLEVDFKN